MGLAAFLRARKEEIVDAWTEEVRARLDLPIETRPQLLNDLPQFIDEMALCAEVPVEGWSTPRSAREHGRHRLELGVDISGLVQEFSAVGETIIGIADRHQVHLTAEEQRLLMRLIGRGTAESVKEYSELRDRQLAEQTRKHFSFAAHELRNPLNTARLAASQLGVPGEEGRSLAGESLQRAHDKLAELIDNSLVQARLSGAPVLELEETSVDTLVHGVIQDVKPAAEQRDQHFDLDVAAFPLTADKKLMTSALTNLLSNAVKFTKKGGRIVLRARRSADHAVFEVQDQCGGMPEDLPARLFEPNVQAGEDRSGFGLGLSITKQAVEAHDGMIRIENQPGVGCCFIVQVPLARPGPDEDQG